MHAHALAQAVHAGGDDLFARREPVQHGQVRTLEGAGLDRAAADSAALWIDHPDRRCAVRSGDDCSDRDQHRGLALGSAGLRGANPGGGSLRQHLHGHARQHPQVRRRRQAGIGQVLLRGGETRTGRVHGGALALHLGPRHGLALFPELAHTFVLGGSSLALRPGHVQRRLVGGRVQPRPEATLGRGPAMAAL